MSKAEGLTLKEYYEAREYVIVIIRKKIVTSLMINAAKRVLNEGIVPLSRVFKTVFPKATYHSGNAKRCLLQMTLVSMHIQNELFVIEKIKGLEYSLLASFLQGKLSRSQEQGITKEELKQPLTLTE